MTRFKEMLQAKETLIVLILLLISWFLKYFNRDSGSQVNRDRLRS